MSNTAPQHIVILGSGIIGLCSAWYLLQSPDLPNGSTVTIIENCTSKRIAPGASSQAGGFIAGGNGSGWVGDASKDLARLSWTCHIELADKLDGREKWGWRETGAVGLRVGSGHNTRSKYRDLPSSGKKETGAAAEWLEAGEKEDLLGGKKGSQAGVGQIDPEQFCHAVHAELSKDARIRTIFGQAKAIERTPSSQRSLSYFPTGSTSSEILQFTTLLVAAGPWSAVVCEQLHLPPLKLTNLPGHSLLIRPALSAVGLRENDSLPSGAVFAGIGEDAHMGVEAATGGTGRHLNEAELALGYTDAPELFPRTNGLVYVAGENSTPTSPSPHPDTLPNRLPPNVDDVKAMLDPALVVRLKKAAAAVSPALRVENGAVIEREQFCYRPKSLDGDCMVGRLAPGVFVATGHGPWGITLGPGTGKVVSELILTPNRPPSADLSRLGIERFAKL